MSATNDTLVDSTSLQTLQDRIDIADVLYKYSSSVDSFDTEGVRSVLADDIWAHYGNGEPVEEMLQAHRNTIGGPGGHLYPCF